MKKMCMMSYYGPNESLGLASNCIGKYGFVMYDFPLYKHIHEHIPNYVDLIVNFIKENEIEYIFWWYINIPTNEFKYIKDITCVKYAYFNWDEPHNWPYCDIINKMSYMDFAFVSCRETIKTYESHGCKAICLYPAFDPLTNYAIENIDMDDYRKYNCDISFCCTNLYDDDIMYPNQYIKRKKLVDDIYNSRHEYGYTFYIYGPEKFAKMYPESYRGNAIYCDLNKIFNYSKINLCTHVLCDKDGYLNERIILIGGSGGLVLVDHVKGLEKTFVPNEHVVILDKNNYIEQISNLLSNYHEYVDMRKSFNDLCVKSFTYDVWGDIISRKILFST